MKKALYVATVDIHIKAFHLPYLKLLHDNGYEVHVATNGDEEFPNCDKKHKICIERSPFKPSNLKAIKQLKKIIDEEKYDIIHCHTPMGSVVARLAAIKARKKYGTRVIYTAHGFHFYKGAPKLNWLLFYPIEKWLAKYTDTLITINKEDYELAKNKFSKRCHDIQYVPGVGIDTKKFDIKMTEKEKTTLKKSLGLKPNDFILTCVARLDKNKNQGFLINVMEELVKENNNIHLLLVGPDELNGYYQKMVEDKNLNNNVHFLGLREDVPELLAISDIVVSASLREGLPVNVMEAFAAGKPVVALNCRGMKDLIEDDKNGYVVHTENEMISKLIEIIKKISKYKTNYSNNKDFANRYCIDNIRYQLSKIYNKKKLILHLLASNSFSGAENVACTIINNLSDLYDFIYCSPDGVISNILKEKDVDYTPIKKMNFFELRKIVNQIHPDVIHAHDFKASFLSCFFTNKSIIISHLHKNDPNMKKISLKSILFLIISKRFSKIVGVSNSIYEEYIFKKAIKNKYVSISNYIDKDRIEKLSKEYKINKKYNLFFFGRLSEEKNPLLFIEIVNAIKDKKIKGVMIGDGPLKNECISKIEKYNLRNSIDIVGFKSNPYPYILSSEIGIMPSKYEGFGLTAIESLILNKNVLNSGVGGLGEIFKNNNYYICKTVDDYVLKYNEIIKKEYTKNKLDSIVSSYTNRQKLISDMQSIYN